MTRLLPFLALLLLAFAAGAAWRQRGRANEQTHGQSPAQDNDAGMGLLLWVPLGGAIVVALVATLLTQLHD